MGMGDGVFSLMNFPPNVRLFFITGYESDSEVCTLGYCDLGFLWTFYVTSDWYGSSLRSREAKGSFSVFCLFAKFMFYWVEISWSSSIEILSFGSSVS